MRDSEPALLDEASAVLGMKHFGKQRRLVRERAPRYAKQRLAAVADERPGFGAGRREHCLKHQAGQVRDQRLERLGKPQTDVDGVSFADSLTAEIVSDLADRHLARLQSLSPRARRIVDKMPGNYIYLGMIHLCLPKATIIHSVRDPLDTCLGCYKQLFATGNETTFDMAMIGQHYQRYRRLMDHWQRVLPGRVIEVVYERLVADPESEIRRLLAACGLPWHEGCLRFHETQRPVRTASMVQVRRPIYRTSVGRWRRYEHLLAPLLEALRPIRDEHQCHDTS